MSNNPGALSLKSNMLWNSIGSLVYLGCSWMTTVLVVVLSNGYEDSGTLSVAMSVGNLTASVVLFKVRPVQVGASSGECSSSDFVGLRVVTSLAAAFFTLIYCLFTVATSNMLPVLAYAFFKIVESFVDVYHGVFQRAGRLDFAGKSQMLRGVVLLAAFVCGMKLFNSLTVATVLMSIGTLVSIGAYDYPRVCRCDKVTPVFDATKLTRLILTCAPGFVSSLLITMVVSVARQSYGTSYGNEALGYYAAVATPCVIIQAVAAYIYSPLYGSIAKARDDHDAVGIRNLVVKVILVIAAFLCACLIGAFVLGESVLTLIYGVKISEYVYLLYGALISTAAAAGISFLLDVLIIQGRLIPVLVASVVPMVACLIGLHWLTPDANSISCLVTASFFLGMVTSFVSLGVELL